MSIWRTNHSFGQEATTAARRDLAIAVLSWLAVLTWISAVIAEVFHWGGASRPPLRDRYEIGADLPINFVVPEPTRGRR
jgi:hypothetical protein